MPLTCGTQRPVLSVVGERGPIDSFGVIRALPGKGMDGDGVEGVVGRTEALLGS